jgi:hypothetical protein
LNVPAAVVYDANWFYLYLVDPVCRLVARTGYSFSSADLEETKQAQISCLNWLKHINVRTVPERITYLGFEMLGFASGVLDAIKIHDEYFQAALLQVVEHMDMADDVSGGAGLFDYFYFYFFLLQKIKKNDP